MNLKSHLVMGLLTIACLACAANAAPLALHPENPHYFLFRGKPTLILTSGEHYGAVLNLDFDYVKYLDTLARDGLNGTRTWSGAYCEPTTAFQIAHNTLAPLAGRFITPWARGDQPGYPNGGNKFDLNKWDKAYFKRLNDFVSQASKRGVVVELNLFCPFYEEGMWALSPMNAKNNINGVGGIDRTNVYTLEKNGGLLAVQERLVRKLVSELKGFDNLYYEICNEPYFGGVTMEWQHHIADVIAQAEQKSRNHHLISQNIANYQDKVRNPHPAVSIFNFHYATPPDTVALNYDLGKVIGDNETGFRGTNDSQYRMEAWDFVTAGGGLFNNLDYSFVAGHEDGTFVYPESQPGGGSAVLRKQYRYLKDLIEHLDLVHMHPEKDLVKAALPEGASVRALVKTGDQYLVYLRTGHGDWQKHPERKVKFSSNELSLQLGLPAKTYVAEWFDTKSGSTTDRAQFSHSGGNKTFAVPGFEDDIALIIRAQSSKP